MAGDWIKMRTDLSEDPAVIDMAERLGMEEFAVVGRLHCLWSWADSQSRDGHATGVTGKWIDRKLQRDGFAAAMVAVKWLAITSTGISFPNFENHNGSTAKTRALGSNRQQKKRAADSTPDDVTPMSRSERDESVTREEKRREEKSNSVPIGTGAKAPMTPDEIIFGYGLSLLTNAGTTEKQARSFLGGLRKAHGDGPLIDSLRDCVKAKPLQPLEWLAAALPPSGVSAKPNRQEAIEQRNHAGAEAWAAQGVIHAAQ